MASERVELPTTDDPCAERCETCRFWGPFFDGNAMDVLLEDTVEPHGRCRRFPPVQQDTEPHEPQDCPTDFWEWPATKPEDWCGEWQAIRPVTPKESVRELPEWGTFTEAFPMRVICNLEFEKPKIESVEQLISFSAPELRTRRNVGALTLLEVQKRLAQFGLKLRGDK